MLKYFLGLLKNFFNTGVSIFAQVDNKSNISRKAKIHRLVKVYQSNIGPYSYVGSRTQLICADIGKFCSIAHRCTIGLGTHSINKISTSPIFTSTKNATAHSWVSTKGFQEFHHVSIGNDVWIGIDVIVMGGVRIGNGAVIGAGSIVTKDIPDYAIAVGVPAKVVKYRFEKSIINKLMEIKWWDLPEGKLKNNLTLFDKDEFMVEDLNNLNDLSLP